MGAGRLRGCGAGVTGFCRVASARAAEAGRARVVLMQHATDSSPSGGVVASLVWRAGGGVLWRKGRRAHMWLSGTRQQLSPRLSPERAGERSARRHMSHMKSAAALARGMRVSSMCFKFLLRTYACTPVAQVRALDSVCESDAGVPTLGPSREWLDIACLVWLCVMFHKSVSILLLLVTREMGVVVCCFVYHRHICMPFDGLDCEVVALVRHVVAVTGQAIVHET